MFSHPFLDNLFRVILNVGIIFFTATVLVESVVSTDQPKYEACKPRNCGIGPNISYPFYIHDAGTDFCGYPGFKIRCEKNEPMYKTSGGNFIIKDISYENQWFRLVHNEVVFNDTCIAPVHNFSFDRSSLSYRPYHADLVFFHNCNESFPVNYTKSVVTCASTATHNTSVALVPRDEDVNWHAACEFLVAAPVQLDELEINQTINSFDYVKLLKDGFTLKWTDYNCAECRGSGGRCGFEADNSACFCPDGSHLRKCNDGDAKLALKLGLLLAIIATGIGIILIILAVCFRKKLSWVKHPMVFWKKKSENYHNIEAFLRNYGSPAPKRYSYIDIKKMTNSFSQKLGQGGYGGVYKGKLHDGRSVAVKVLNESKGNGEEFINEVATISRTSHVNIVALLGFCFEGGKRALIYEFVPNGSLEKFIYGKDPLEMNQKLKWKTLYQIAIGIARGLEYLHRGCSTRILHFDIKPHNILLDEDLSPKISDFGLAKICSRNESIIPMTGARGTIGYIAPEVCCRNFGEVSHKSDVYSYGMMVLEMVGGRKNIDVGVDRTSEIYFPHWIYRHLEVDEQLGLQGITNEEDKECARKMVIVSLWCIQTNPLDRPTISRVVDMLEGRLGSLEIPPKPFLSSPTSRPAESSSPLVC